MLSGMLALRHLPPFAWLRLSRSSSRSETANPAAPPPRDLSPGAGPARPSEPPRSKGAAAATGQPMEWCVATDPSTHPRLVVSYVFSGRVG
jgi:hypothetical protein